MYTSNSGQYLASSLSENVGEKTKRFDLFITIFASTDNQLLPLSPLKPPDRYNIRQHYQSQFKISKAFR